MATDNTSSKGKAIASALNFVSFLLLNLSEHELGNIRQILLLDRKIFIDSAVNLKGRIAEIAKQFPYPVAAEAGKLAGETIPKSAIILYSKFQKTACGKAKTLISWEIIRPDSARVLLNKRLFGYKHHGVFYEGLMQKYSGEKLGKGCISVPSEFAGKFTSLFREMRIEIIVKEVAEVD